MRKKQHLVPLLASMMILTGCAGLGATSNNEPLEDTHWELIAVGERQSVDMADAHLVLHAEDARVAGSTGCNRLMGGYEHTGDQLSFGQMATTMKACPGEVMALEKDFLEALDDVASWKVEGNVLTLLDTQDAAQARFKALHP